MSAGHMAFLRGWKFLMSEVALSTATLKALTQPGFLPVVGHVGAGDLSIVLLYGPTGFLTGEFCDVPLKGTHAAWAAQASFQSLGISARTL